ncbi:hypothetical protein IWT5_02237 [Secundilactobacillus silagincola]|uniref:Uncharacterized protein n=1 Tax=Secundilactobacillus silagincola TaxID=1714681 RepID=A0A1Z5J4V4_9LACO|nr:hypothetical protein IWT5_02237 [Secundilactobacillus silagincola]
MCYWNEEAAGFVHVEYDEWHEKWKHIELVFDFLEHNAPRQVIFGYLILPLLVRNTYM